MRKETSIYLDVLRFLAVLLVFVDHAKRPAFTGGFLYFLGTFGQEAVAIFFVLSGLVVSHVAFTRERSLFSYSIARLARLWSVVIPAILLTVVLDSLGHRIDPGLYAHALLPQWRLDAASLGRMISPALFLNSVPPFHVAVGSDGPFWSLSYEAWYYAAFGLAAFLSGWRRILGVMAVAWLAGPDIRALAPIWLLGVAVGSLLGKGRESLLAWAGFFGTIIGLMLLAAVRYKLIAALKIILPHDVIPGITSTNLVEDYGTTTLVALNIVCFDRIAGHFGRLARLLERPVRMAVARSFSIYLYQAPLLFFIASLLHGVAMRPVRILVLYAGTLALCALLAEYTERRKSTVARWLKAGCAFAVPRSAPEPGS